MEKGAITIVRAEFSAICAEIHAERVPLLVYTGRTPLVAIVPTDRRGRIVTLDGDIVTTWDEPAGDDS